MVITCPVVSSARTNWTFLGTLTGPLGAGVAGSGGASPSAGGAGGAATPMPCGEGEGC
jgi:hypothetical protein